MGNIELFFDGFCPESLLNGKQVEMKLNEDDFWESIETRLQIAVFPPFATILNWRGAGKFRESSKNASDTQVGMVMARPYTEEGREIFPDEKSVIHNANELRCYLDEIYNSKKELEASKFDANDPALKVQEEYLSSLTFDNLEPLFKLYNKLKSVGYKVDSAHSALFEKFHSMLYDIKLVFSFDWMNWKEWSKNLNNNNYDFTQCTLLQLSMYITAIFRGDRFSDGLINSMFKNGVMDKIFVSLNQIYE